MSIPSSTLLIHEKHEPELRRVLLKWVTVTDTQGNRPPQMHWWIS
jgi:hypothetical protein